jgi:hypothetical protein
MAVPEQPRKPDEARRGEDATATLARQRVSAQKALFLLLLVIYAYFIPRGAMANADSHLALTYSIVESGTLRIDRFALNPDLIDKSVYCGGNAVPCTHYYTDKAPGLSLFAALAYFPLHYVLPASMMPSSPTADRFLLRYLLTLLVISLPCCIFALVLWRFLSRLTSDRWAMVLTIGYACGTIAMPFSMQLFSHALTAALLFSAFILLYSYAALGRPSRSLLPALAGLLSGLSVGQEYPAAIIAGILGLYAIATDIRRHTLPRGTVACALGALLGVCPALAYNYAVYGSPLAFGYAHLTDAYYAAGMSHGILGVSTPHLDALWGTTFSPFRGLFVLSPWLLLAAPGFLCMWRRGVRREALLCACIVTAYFVFQISYAFWNGGASVGPRHFLPALPFLIVPIAYIDRSRALRRAGALLIVYSALVLLAVVATNPLFGDPRYVPGLYNPLVDQTLHDMLTGHWQNTWATLFGLRGLLGLAPLAILAAALARRIARDLPGAALP